jgi:guanylate kinase
VERISTEGKYPIFDVDVVGGLNIKKMFPEQALAIFIKTPTPETLESRLRTRASDSEASLRKRIDKAKWELTFEKDFDRVLINDRLDETLLNAEEMVRKYLDII